MFLPTIFSTSSYRTRERFYFQPSRSIASSFLEFQINLSTPWPPRMYPAYISIHTFTWQVFTSLNIGAITPPSTQALVHALYEHISLFFSPRDTRQSCVQRRIKRNWNSNEPDVPAIWCTWSIISYPHTYACMHQVFAFVNKNREKKRKKANKFVERITNGNELVPTKLYFIIRDPFGDFQVASWMQHCLKCISEWGRGLRLNIGNDFRRGNTV